MKNNKNDILNRGYENSTPEFSTIIRIVVGILLFLVAVYYLGGVVTGNIKLKKDPKTVEIQYSEILAEQTFKQNNDSYYVLYYDFSLNEKSVVEAFSSNLSNDASLYKVDLNKKFNSLYVTSDNSNKNPKNLSELKINGITLIKINNGKVEKYIEGIDNIKQYSLNL